jgi:hypothetical protein
MVRNRRTPRPSWSKVAAQTKPGKNASAALSWPRRVPFICFVVLRDMNGNTASHPVRRCAIPSHSSLFHVAIVFKAASCSRAFSTSPQRDELSPRQPYAGRHNGNESDTSAESKDRGQAARNEMKSRSTMG